MGARAERSAGSFQEFLVDAMAEWPHFRIEGNGEAYRPT
jgi:hypothetical protein